MVNQTMGKLHMLDDRHAQPASSISVRFNDVSPGDIFHAIDFPPSIFAEIFLDLISAPCHILRHLWVNNFAWRPKENAGRWIDRKKKAAKRKATPPPPKAQIRPRCGATSIERPDRAGRLQGMHFL